MAVGSGSDRCTYDDAADRLVSFKPAYVVGYSVALGRLARINRNRSGDFAKLGLRCVIATGESFATPDERDLVESVFVNAGLFCVAGLRVGALGLPVLLALRTRRSRASTSPAHGEAGHTARR